MKRLLLILLCLSLTSCTYIGATEEILISSPYALSVSTIESFDKAADQTPTTATDENGTPAETTGDTSPEKPEITQLIISKTTNKIHYYENCSYAASISDKNRQFAFVSQEEELKQNGYTVCSWCEKHKNGE